MKTRAIKEFFGLACSNGIPDDSDYYRAAEEAVLELEEIESRYERIGNSLVGVGASFQAILDKISELQDLQRGFEHRLTNLGFSSWEQLLDTMTVLRRDQKTTDEKAYLEALIEEQVKPSSAEVSRRKSEAFWRMLAAAIYVPLHAGLTEDELIAVIRLRCVRLRKEARAAEQEKKS